MADAKMWRSQPEPHFPLESQIVCRSQRPKLETSRAVRWVERCRNCNPDHPVGIAIPPRGPASRSVICIDIQWTGTETMGTPQFTNNNIVQTTKSGPTQPNRSSEIILPCSQSLSTIEISQTVNCRNALHKPRKSPVNSGANGFSHLYIESAPGLLRGRNTSRLPIGVFGRVPLFAKPKVIQDSLL